MELTGRERHNGRFPESDYLSRKLIAVAKVNVFSKQMSGTVYTPPALVRSDRNVPPRYPGQRPESMWWKYGNT
jgi:hypothetical protein